VSFPLIDDPQDPLRPVLRLFLSVDIVGSTAFKQTPLRKVKGELPSEPETLPAEPWFSPIALFYREVERLFAKEWASYVDNVEARHSWPTGATPELWKSAGDELIYTKVLTDHREALCCLNAWIAALKQYRTVLRSQFPSLDLKSTAWIAGFPVHNTEVIFRSSVAKFDALADDDDPLYTNLRLLEEYYNSHDRSHLTRDFIGPAIDTGFRLCTLATPRKLVVAVDLVLMLINALRTQPMHFPYEALKFYYEGRFPLKGVIGGEPYPVFWVDMKSDDPLEASEDKIRGVEPRNSDEVKDFCEQYLKHSNHIILPYIVQNQDPYFGTVPGYHADRLNKLRLYLKNEKQKRQQEAEAAFKNDEGSELPPEAQDFLIDLLKTVEAHESTRPQPHRSSHENNNG
jgi:hypothetical protein